MTSLQSQTPIQAPDDPIQELQNWKTWKLEDPELKRESQTIIPYNNDKILVFGGYKNNVTQRVFSLILKDPETQTFKVIPSVGGVESCSWGDMSACYWKDSTVVVFGGYDYVKGDAYSTVAIVTLKDLDSESIFFNIVIVFSALQRSFCTLEENAHIYRDKMFVFAGHDGGDDVSDIWCLDLAEWTWTQCLFEGYPPKDDDFLDKFVFHENKAYSIQRGPFTGAETMKEFDLENMTYKLHTMKKSQTDDPVRFHSFPQVVNGKIYAIKSVNQGPPGNSLTRHLSVLDLDSQNWIEIETEPFTDIRRIIRTLSWNNHLIFYASGVDRSLIELWSLSLNPPSKPSKYSSTSMTVDKVQRTMKEFLYEAPYSDISFEVESQIIPAHKWLLIQKSTFFANLFSSKMQEENPSKTTITDLKALSFRALLEYLYSGHVEIDDQIALELLQKTKKYSIPGELKNTCENHLSNNIEPENYVALGKLAESVGATSLRDSVVTFIARNMEKIKPRKDFNDISDALLRESIVKFIVK